MDFNKEIVEFMSDKIGGIVITTEGSREIVYADRFFTDLYGEDLKGMFAEDVLFWLNDAPDLPEDGSAIEWENIDTDKKRYYKINSASFMKDERKYRIHSMTDITEYMGLNRDVTKYMSFFKKLSNFQSKVLENLSNTYYELLPMISNYFSTSKAYIFLQHEGNLDMITYNKVGSQYSNDRINMNAMVEAVFSAESGTDIALSEFADEIQEALKIGGSTEDSVFGKLCSGSVSGQKYAIYLSIWPNTDKDSMKENTLLSVIQLYIENGIMREKLIYNSEHDHLTGLYNKGKYLDMIESTYGTMNSIGIFNFDVNNLKVMNDTYGHEAGDKLLIKAANSIRKVTSNKIHGYRMGGDEYLMIACDVTKEEVDSLKERWEKELARLNQLDDGIDCVIAVGVAYGEKEYDLPALLKEADELMYEDKKRKKKPGEEIR